MFNLANKVYGKCMENLTQPVLISNWFNTRTSFALHGSAAHIVPGLIPLMMATLSGLDDG